ncbi:MAG: hypothetical protein FJ109_16140 [Deltaproteobacteria bacterium]|nr:hypothetical protein [Deltaproteobacteria bacterium]
MWGEEGEADWGTADVKMDLVECSPTCSGGDVAGPRCGPDGCCGECGECGPGQTCIEFECVSCTPNCE